MTASDQIDSMKRMMAMVRAGHPMCCHSPKGLKLTACSSWKKARLLTVCEAKCAS